MTTSKRVLVTTISFAMLAMLVAPLIIAVFFTVLNGWAHSFSEFLFYVWDMIISVAEHVIALLVIMMISGLLAAMAGFYFGLMYQRISFLWLIISTCVLSSLISVIVSFITICILIEFRYSDISLIMSAMFYIGIIGFLCSIVICALFIPLHYKNKL